MYNCVIESLNSEHVVAGPRVKIHNYNIQILAKVPITLFTRKAVHDQIGIPAERGRPFVLLGKDKRNINVFQNRLNFAIYLF